MKVSRAAQTTGPLGVVIDVDRSRAADGVLVVLLAGDIDLFSVPRLRAVLADAVGRTDLVLDLHEVEFCDSSALRVFVDAQRGQAAAGRTLEIRSPSLPVRDLFEVSGLRGVLRVT